MARKTKIGLSYFPLDVNFFTDDKILFVSARFGIKGELIAIKLLCKIYSDKGYYKKWSEDEALLFAKHVGFEYMLVNDVVNELIKRDFFNKIIFDSFGVLTSKGIQERYFEVASRRKENVEIKEYLINVDINSLNVNINPLNDYKSTQSKVKESKLKETKVNEITKAPQNYFFKIRELIHYEKPSEYFQKNFVTFWQDYLNKNGVEFHNEVMEQVDVKYNQSQFNNENHFRHTFTSTHEKLKKYPTKKESGLKEVFDSHKEAENRIKARHENE